MNVRLRMTATAALATLLASLSLASTFDDTDWLGPVIVCVVAAALGCAAGRRLGLPRPLVPLPGIALLVLALTVIYARDVAVLGLIPGPGALRALDQLATLGFDGMRRYATPAPTDAGLVLLAAGGTGLVAILVDTLAVTYRSAALAGVPLLALYAVPVVVVRDGVPWLLFLVAALGWLLLLLAEGRERLAGWGRALDRRSAKGDNIFTQTPAEPLGVVGRRIGATALGLALVLPAILPWAAGGLFRNGGTGGSGAGSGRSFGTSVDPFVQIGAQLGARSSSTLLTYTTDDRTPDYLRMVTLDRFNGTTWLAAEPRSTGDARDLEDRSTIGLLGHDVASRITIYKLDQTWLPRAAPTTRILDLSGHWSYDSSTGDVFAQGGTTTHDEAYEVDSRHLALTAEALRAQGEIAPSLLARNTRLPAGVAASVRALTHTITDRQPTAYDKALALQQFFLDDKNGFRYTTTAPKAKGDPLVAFLTNRQGFCQQFAGAFAVMARIAGLPTRIEIGFSQGAQANDGSWKVTNYNAHAWPEVYFAGYGWVRFEPTKSAPTGVGQPTWAPGPNTGGPGPINTPGGGNQVSQAQHNAQRDQADNGTVPLPPPPAATAAPTRIPWQPILGVLALLALAAPGVARVVRRRRRLAARTWPDERVRVRTAWSELADTAHDLRVPFPASSTPRSTAAYVAASGVGPEAAAAVGRLAGAVEREQYAPVGTTLVDGFDPGADARTVAVAMERAAGRRDRWRARLMPASVLTVAATGLADALDLIDRSWARVRSALLRPFVRSRQATP